MSRCLSFFLALLAASALAKTPVPKAFSQKPNALSQSTRYTYDASGNQLTVTDAAGHTTTSHYDAANRLVQLEEPSASGTVSRYTYYDGLGRKIQENDEAGVATAYTYDFRGLLTSVTLAFGTTQAMTTVYQYDELGNEIKQTDANGHSTTFKYDALGRRTARLLPDGQTETFGYDIAGNLIYQTNFNSVVITNRYDLNNRLTNCSAPGYKVTYAYNAIGLRTNMTDASGVTAYFYNSLGELTNKTVTWSGQSPVALNYRYDSLGSLTNLWSSTANGVSNAYQFDLLGRITNVLANGSSVANYGFDAVGNLQTLRYGNGVTNLYQYDAMNRLTNQVWKLNNTVLANFAYTLGATGNRIASSETVNGTSHTYAWAYDYLYRLTGESIQNIGTVNYQFDAVGNRTNRTSSVSGLNNQNFAFNPNDWQTNTDNYDSNGNTIGSSGKTYQYDALNHLTNVNSGAILITYDGDGNRVKKTVGGVTTYYLVDDRNPSGYAQVLEEYQGSSLSKVYNYGLALISQRQANGTVSYFGSDGHGSTRFLLNTSGGITDTYTYDSYGVLIANTGSTPNSYLYCGQQWDNDLQMYYLRARYYKPDYGRFWTMDSYEGNTQDPLSLHKYLYVWDDPVTHTDLSGHDLGDVMVTMYLQTLSFAQRIGPTIMARIAAQRAIVKIGAVAAASVITAMYGDSEFAGSAPDDDQSKKINRAINIMTQNGYAKNARRAASLRYRVVDMDGTAWGYNPLFSVRTIWLDPMAFSLDDLFFASLIIHETEHTTQYLFKKEKGAYQIESDFLRSVGISGTVANLAAKYPSDSSFIDDAADGMRQYEVSNPAIIH